MIATKRGPRRPAALCGVILAGGHRWGGNELESIIPRALLPIAGSPLAAYALRTLRAAGIREIIICATSATLAIARAFGDGSDFDLDIHYFEDITPRGPAGCIREAAEISSADTFVAIEISSIIRGSVREVVDQHLTSQAALTLGLASDSFSGGGASSSRPAGVFACERSAVEDVKSIGYADVKETLIPRLRERGKNVVSVPIGIDSVRVRDFDSYLAANEILLHQLLNDRVALPMHERRADSLIHRSARVSERSKLIGPVWIGPNAEISAGATLIGPVCVGRGAKIGTGSAVASSVLWDDSIVAEACHVDACVLSCGAQVSAGESTYHALKTHVGMGSLARGLRSATPAARSRTWSPNSGVES